MAIIVLHRYSGMVNGDLLVHVENPPPPTPDDGESTFTAFRFPAHLLYSRHWRPKTPSVSEEVVDTTEPCNAWSQETVQATTWTSETITVLCNV